MKNLSLIFLAFITLFNLSMAQIGSIISSDRRVDWRNPGYEGNIPRVAKNFVNVKTQYIIGQGKSSTDAIIQAINDADTWNKSNPGNFSVLYFPEGDYTFESDIYLKDSIIIKGDGSDKTRFTFTIYGFKIFGNEEGAAVGISSSDYNSATKTLNINLTSDWKENWLDKGGDNRFLQIKVPNGYWHKPGQDGNEYVGQIVKVQSYTSTSITFVDDIGLTLSCAGPSNPATLGRFNAITGVGFEDFKVSTSGTLNTHFTFSLVANCWVSGVESYNPGWHHISIGASTYIEVRGCYIYEAKDVCTGGRGYGVFIGNHATNCLIEDNIFRRLRHSMIAYGGANRNVFGYNFSGERHAEDRPFGSCSDMSEWEADLLFHGRFPFANLMEGNRVDFINGAVVHGINGPYNTIFRNKIVSNATIASEGGIRIDTYIEYTELCQYFNIYGNVLNDIDDQNWTTCGIADGYNGRMDPEGSKGDAPYSDISYYYEQQPQFIANAGLTWPPVGTRTGPLLSQTNPAEQRWWGGSSKKTVSAGQVCTFSFTAQQFLSEGGSPSGGTYKINGTNVGTTWNGVVANNQPVTIEAIPPDNNYAFYQWSDGSTDNPRSLTLTGNTTLYAMCKRHLYSPSSTATANNNQRKIAQTKDGTYFMVYESQNRIWITKSSDGVNWGNEFEVSSGANWYNKSPSITAHENGYTIAVVWQGIDGSGNSSCIYFRLYNYHPFFNPSGVWSNLEQFPVFYPWEAGYEASPVVSGWDIDGNGNSATVVWREPSGLAVRTKKNGSWSSVTYIPNTNGNCLWPSITRYHSNIFAICWQNNNTGSIDYIETYYNTSQLFLPETPVSVSPPGWTTNERPSVAVNGDWMIIVTWQSYNTIIEDGYSVHMREKPHGPYWNSSIVSYSSSVGNPILGTFLDLSSYYLFWESEAGVFSTRGLGTTWTSPDIIAYGSSGGTGISAINRSRTSLREIWRKPNGQIAVHNSGLQKAGNAEKFVSYRLNKHMITYLDSIPELAKKGYKGMIAFEIAGLAHQSNGLSTAKESKGEENKLRSEQILVRSNNEVLKLAGAYYAKGLEVPENAQLNEITNLLTVAIKDAKTNEILKEVWNIPLSKLSTRTGTTDGQYQEINIPLSGLNGKEIYLDVAAKDTSHPIFVYDHYLLSKEDERLKKFFAEKSTLPTKYALHQNYPNPFNPSTTIRFDLIEPQNVMLKVYNSIGQEIKTIVNDYYTEGSHEVIFDASSLSSGVYFYRIIAGQFTATKSFVLLK